MLRTVEFDTDLELIPTHINARYYRAPFVEYFDLSLRPRQAVADKNKACSGLPW